ncbi:MAG: response regulator [Elusimicrobia bacterium]|nr:response regulator [Elusimicrobiota bacterium]
MTVQDGDPAKKKTILVVDDERGMREVLKRILEDENHQVLLAEDGESALNLIRELRPDMVLLDVMLPGISGLAVCHEVRKNPVLSDIPILMLTGQDDPMTQKKGKGLGADDYLAKPFQVDELLARVAALFKRFEAGNVDGGG